MPDLGLLITIGIVLIILDFISIAIGMISSSLANENNEQKDTHTHDNTKVSEKKVKGVGIIFIGPIPIIFGSDKRYAIIAILLAIVLMVPAIVFHLFE
jgi:uncharacterized protein (TIGR00304 family)